MAWTTLGTVAPGDVLRANSGTAAYNNVIGNLNVFASAWTSWTPVVTQGVNPTFTNTRSRYIKVGRLVIATFAVAITSSGTSNTAMALNFGGIATASTADSAYGAFRIFDTGITNYAGTLVAASSTVMNLYQDGNGNPLGFGQQFTSGDLFSGFFVFEAAS
jgi:hypothetical protein